MLSSREYFAGQALNAMLRSSYDCNCSGYEFKNIVAGAREYADDLVNELRKTSEQGESPATDRQQLKAEIVVDIVNKVLSKNTMLSGQCRLDIARKVQQQLSAV